MSVKLRNEVRKMTKERLTNINRECERRRRERKMTGR